MKVVCLGWGSLIWDPRSLPMTGEWNDDGPLLPVEFARQSSDGRLTLVLMPGARPVPTFWTRLDVADVADAVTTLSARERCPGKFIGRWPAGRAGEVSDVVESWATQKGVGGVVWTDLPPQFEGEAGRAPSPEQMVSYLSGLAEPIRARAREYIVNAPAGVHTPGRALIERELGWCSDGA